MLHRDLCAFLSYLRILAHSPLLIRLKLDFKSIDNETGNPRSRSISNNQKTISTDYLALFIDVRRNSSYIIVPISLLIIVNSLKLYIKISLSSRSSAPKITTRVICQSSDDSYEIRVIFEPKVTVVK